MDDKTLEGGFRNTKREVHRFLPARSAGDSVFPAIKKVESNPKEPSALTEGLAD